MIFYEFMRGYVVKITQNTNKFVQTAAFNALVWSFAQNYDRRILILNN
jgi:hypothetical protein